MKLCELSKLYTGYFEVYVIKDSEEVICSCQQFLDIDSSFLCSDPREILQIIPISECKIRVYVKEA